MNIIKSLLIFFLSFQFACAQEPIDRPHCEDAKFDAKVAQLISFSIPVIGVSELEKVQEDVIIFDTREKEEFDISHIEGARFLGYRNLESSVLENIDKNSKIVVYCSVGYRSEKIGEKLNKLGFTNVHNLYGSIFEWVNQGNPIVDKNGDKTKKIHTYNKKWSQWVDENMGKKVW